MLAFSQAHCSPDRSARALFQCEPHTHDPASGAPPQAPAPTSCGSCHLLAAVSLGGAAWWPCRFVVPSQAPAMR